MNKQNMYVKKFANSLNFAVFQNTPSRPPCMHCDELNLGVNGVYEPSFMSIKHTPHDAPSHRWDNKINVGVICYCNVLEEIGGAEAPRRQFALHPQVLFLTIVLRLLSWKRTLGNALPVRLTWIV